MMRRIKSMPGSMLAVALAAVVMTAATANAQERPPIPSQQCTAALDPAEIAVQAEEVGVVATYSQDIGKTLRATIQEESGVQVLAIEPVATMLDAAGVNLTLNASQAAVGEWTITFEGENGTCAGKLRVTGGGGPQG
ncbi:MAG TPA: hypothetical protein VF188_07170 [Longimicrobiales bacterium]